MKLLDGKNISAMYVVHARNTGGDVWIRERELALAGESEKSGISLFSINFRSKWEMANYSRGAKPSYCYR